MNISEFLHGVGFKHYGSVVNSWDSFNNIGSVLMQLWADAGKRVRHHPLQGAYLRVLCYDSAHAISEGLNYKVGYAGRTKAITSIENGATGYAALSSPLAGKRGPGVWAKHADLSKVYPILAIERDQASDDVYVILGQPINSDAMI